MASPLAPRSSLARRLLRGLPLAAALALPIVAAACSADPTEEAGATEDRVVLGDGPLVVNGHDEPIEVPARGSVLTEIVQPELVAALEKGGYPISTALGGTGRLTNAELAQSSAMYASIATSLTADLDALKAQDRTLTTRVIGGQGRLFDAGWLRSPKATFELVGAVGRLDRRDAQADGRCGEVRFLYRLAYAAGDTKGTAFSRLPFFFNVVYDVPAGDCRAIAQKWMSPGPMSAEDYVAWLSAGALDRAALRLKQVEVNAQVVRLPSEVKSDMGGHAEYFLRVFAMEGGELRLQPLENTPDVERLTSDPKLRGELRDWIVANIRGIDEGTAVMPAKFAATKAVSFTTFGSARKRNKLFSKLFGASDLAAADLTSATLVGTPEALLFRLDDMTCVGCHQGSSVAGFHFLGKERGSRTNPLNALRTHGSPHYLSEQGRRAEYVQALVDGKATPRARATSFDPPRDEAAKVGTHCVLPDDRKHFKHTWDCEPSTTCKAIATNASTGIELGQCMPEKEGFAGLPCLTGAVTEGATARGDRLGKTEMGCKGAYVCLDPVQGTPGGLCINHCKGALGTMNGPHEICAYGAKTGFDACAASADFNRCLPDVVSPSARQACDEDNPCREDYMCQRLEPIGATYSTTPKMKGFCNPTYFIFQMRLDGHPLPGG